jgi:hypothetical protein
MKLLRTFTMIALLSGVAYAQTPPPAKTPAPAADKKAAPPAADKKAAPPAPVDKPKEEISTAEAEKFLAFFNKIADAMVANKDDCTKLAASLNKLIDTNKDLLKKANEATASGKQLPKSLEEKMKARVPDMMPAMQKCQSDKGVMDAMQRMDGGAKKPEAAPAAPAKTDTKAPAAKTDAKAPAAKK